LLSEPLQLSMVLLFQDLDALSDVLDLNILVRQLLLNVNSFLLYLLNFSRFFDIEFNGFALKDSKFLISCILGLIKDVG